MRQESAFLEEICERPGDDAVRLVFADWLDDQGEEARAGFVRDQVALARMDLADPRYPALLARTRRSGMLTGEGRSRFDHAAGAKVMFRRGLVAGVALSADAYLYQPFFNERRLPVEQLRLVHKGGIRSSDPEALVDHPELARLHTLDVGGACLGFWELEALITDCPALAGLRAIVIPVPWYADDPEKSFPGLIRRLALPSLDSLRLYDSFLHDAWQAIPEGCRSPLRRLHLSYYTEVDDEQTALPTWDWLCQTAHWPHLEHAALWHDLRTASGGSYTRSPRYRGSATAQPSSRLHDLTVSVWDIPHLLRCPDWGPVRTLRIARDYQTGLIDGLENTPGAHNLEALSLEDLGVSDGCAEAFYRGPSLANLRHLGPWPIVEGHWRHMRAAPFLPRLLTLDLQPQEWCDRSPAEWMAEAPLTELRTLTLAGPRSLKDLAPLLKSKNLPSLCTLSLPDVRDQQDAADALAQAAKNLPHLSLVHLGREEPTGWYVLSGDGKASPVTQDVFPLDEDWWQARPFPHWSDEG